MSKHIRLVELFCPRFFWGEKMTRDLFSKMTLLKFREYSRAYSEYSMPIDTTDYICNHILFCIEEVDELVPVSAVKTLPYDACELFHIDFTINKMLEEADAPDHQNTLKRIIGETEKNQRRIGYHSSWTIDKRARKDKELKSLIKNLFLASAYFHHTESSIDELIGLGVPRFSTDQFFSQMGYRPIQQEGKEMDHLHISSYSDVEVIVMHLKKFEQEFVERAKVFEKYWRERLVLGENVDFREEFRDSTRFKNQLLAS